MSGVILLEGRVKVFVNGNLIREGPNLVVTAGKNLVAEIVAASPTKPSHMGFGTGGSPIVSTSESQTALSAEYAFGGYARKTITVSRVNNVVTYQTSSGHWINNSGGSLTLGEIGIFNASSAGTMLARFLTSPITLQASAVVNVQWALTFG